MCILPSANFTLSSIVALSVRDFNHKSRFIWQLLRCLYVLQQSQSKGCERLKLANAFLPRHPIPNLMVALCIEFFVLPHS